MLYDLKQKWTHILSKVRAYIETSWLFGKIFSSFCEFLILNHNFDGLGLLAKTLTIPDGNDSIISPDIFTLHLK